MATRKQPTADQQVEAMTQAPSKDWRMTVPANGLPALSEEREELEPGERIAELLRASGDENTQVRVFRRIPGTTKYAWCVNYTADEFTTGDLGMIRDQWGAGEYSLRIYGGSRGIIAREDITIAPTSNPTPAANVPVPAASDSLARVLEAMQAQHAALMTALTQRPDPRADMMQTLEMLRLMREAMGTQPAAVVNPSSVLNDVVSAIKTLREASSELSPPAPAVDPSDPMTMLPGIMDTIKAIATRGNAPALPAPAAQAPADASHAETQLRALLQGLLALTGQPAEAGADYVLRNFPDEILAYVDSPAWFDFMTAFSPQSAQHRAWLEKVREICLRQMVTDDDPAGAPPT